MFRAGGGTAEKKALYVELKALSPLYRWCL